MKGLAQLSGLLAGCAAAGAASFVFIEPQPVKASLSESYQQTIRVNGEKEKRCDLLFDRRL